MSDRTTEEAMAALRRLLDETSGLDRRTFLRRLSIAAAGSAVLSPLAGMIGSARANSPVTTMGHGGAWKDAMMLAYFKPFEEKSKTPVQFVTPYDFSKIRAMHEANNQQIDFFSASTLDAPRITRANMNAPLDFNVIDKSALSPQQFKYPNAIGAVSTSTVIVYSKKKWPTGNGPQNWADFWNVKKFPGPRAMWKRANPVLEAALLADGVPKDKMYPLDVDRAFKKLDEIKPHVVNWWATGSDSQQLIQDQEVDVTMMWNGRASESINQNKANYSMIWNEALYSGISESWVVMKNSPNPAAAMRAMDIVGRAEPQAAFARALHYGPTNQKAYDFIEERFAKELPSYPANEKVSLLLNFEWWLDNGDPVIKRFEQWLQG